MDARDFRTKIIWVFAVVVCLTVLSPFALAHEGLHEQIVAVTAKIKTRSKKRLSLPATR